MPADFKAKLRAGEAQMGIILTLPSPEIAEIMAAAGFDWLFIDLEHSSMSLRDAQRLMQAAQAHLPCVVRVPANAEVWVKRCLDLGADGLVIPQVRSQDDARQAVRWAKYPPQGERSVGIGRAHGYGPRFAEYVAGANQETALILQIEHIQAVEAAAQIVAVDGVDGIFVGPYDLSGSMGKTGRVDDPEVRAAVAHTRRVCLDHAMPLGIFAASAETAADRAREGFTFMAVGIDVTLLAHAAEKTVAALRRG